ncbi:MAG TPA: VIT1/CCC1 transporter family protein [Gaiellaceae bacterium]|nr:VIT1/CCC1 transporter family protein [Gaiellaceae bacterium]
MDDAVSGEQLALWREILQEEVDAAAIYRAAARNEEDARSRESLERMATEEERHARVWSERIAAAGGDGSIPEPSRRARMLASLTGRFSRSTVFPIMLERERLAIAAYAPDEQVAELAPEEASHEAALAELVSATKSQPFARAIARTEVRGRSGSGNALRAAVLGVNDGLVSNLSLVMGVAGAGVASQDILITGFAGLIAGAGSMAMGEWISVTSSRELLSRLLRIEREEIALDPELERAELSLIYEDKGLDPLQARRVADALSRDPERALDVHAREELGFDPEELGGSAWVAAGTSFALFVVGAIVPVAPFLFLDGGAAVATAVVLSAVALLGIGAAITILTGRNVALSALRQLAFGAAAAAITYGVGALFGVALD